MRELKDFNQGDTVEVYCKYCPWRSGDKFMVAQNLVAGTQAPRFGRSDGWAKAIVVDKADHNPMQAVMPVPDESQSTGVWVRIKFLDSTWVDSKGQILDEKSLFQWVSASSEDIRPFAPQYVPEVSIAVVRWGGSVPVDERRFDFGLSDKLIQECLDSVHSKLQRTVEIHTVYITHTSDISKVNHHHVFTSMRASRNKFAMFFLWGSSTDSKPGYVLVPDLIDLMHRFESVGIVTKNPNHAQVYEAITSKQYQANLCVCEQLKIPATVSVPVSLVLSNPETTVQNIIRSLETLRTRVHRVNIAGKPFASGLVKVGNEWMGDGVRAFSGQDDLRAKIVALLDGPHGIVRSVIVQERVPSVICEPRVFVYNGMAKGIRYTWNQKEDSKTGRIHALRTCPQSRAADELFQGDVGAQKYVERKLAQLVQEWNTWLLTLGGEIPVFVRMDFLVEKVGVPIDIDLATAGEDPWYWEENAEKNEKKTDDILPPVGPHEDDEKYAEKYRVWTCELGEIGSSMVGFREGKAMLFNAIATSCVSLGKRPVRAAPKLS